MTLINEIKYFYEKVQNYKTNQLLLNENNENDSNQMHERLRMLPPKIIVKEKFIIKQYWDSVVKLQNNRQRLTQHLSQNPKYQQKIQELEKKLKELEDNMNDEIIDVVNDNSNNNININNDNNEPEIKKKAKMHRHSLSSINPNNLPLINDENDKENVDNSNNNDNNNNDNTTSDFDWGGLSASAIDALLGNNTDNNNDEGEALFNELEEKEKMIYDLENEIDSLKQQLQNKQLSTTENIIPLDDDIEDKKRYGE